MSQCSLNITHLFSCQFNLFQLGLPFSHLAWNNEIEFFDDMSSLHILPPTVIMKVTEHVPQIIDFIRKLEYKEFAYSVPSGKLSEGQDLSQLVDQ